MFVGHGLVAFALVVFGGRRADWAPDRVLALGALAFAFATLPDIDIVYALGGPMTALSGPFAAADAFWATSSLVHRTVTHSLVVGTVAAVAFTCWHLATTGRDRRGRVGYGTVAAAGLASLALVGFVTTGPLAGAILLLFGLVGLALTTAATRRLPWLGPRAVLATALLGLLTHPFGDLFTGEPPAMLYPLDVSLVTTRLALHPDPTLHLLTAFGIELLTIWIAVAAALWLTDRRLRSHASPRAVLGLGYAGVALVVPAPTLDVSYHFVFSILAVASVGTVELRRGPFGRRLAGDGGTVETGGSSTLAGVGLADGTTALVTGLAAVSTAGVGYTVVYLLV